MISENEKIFDEEASNNCKPNYPLNNFSSEEDKTGYDKVIKRKITNIETYLVFGDTKSPVDFEHMDIQKKSFE